MSKSTTTINKEIGQIVELHEFIRDMVTPAAQSIIRELMLKPNQNATSLSKKANVTYTTALKVLKKLENISVVEKKNDFTYKLTPRLINRVRTASKNLFNKIQSN